MRSLLIIAVLIVSFTPLGYTKAEILSEPLCFLVINKTKNDVNGSFWTDLYTRPDGVQTRHRSNFRLQEADAQDEDGYPADRAEFCSYGPFYPGRKLDFKIRTLFPVFSCKTSVESGPIIITNKPREDGGYDYSATCYD